MVQRHKVSEGRAHLHNIGQPAICDSSLYRVSGEAIKKGRVLHVDFPGVTHRL
jgi:hypothetical protein